MALQLRLPAQRQLPLPLPLLLPLPLPLLLKLPLQWVPVLWSHVPGAEIG